MKEHKHIGFCLCTYRKGPCLDCPSLKECLELRDKEIAEQKDKDEKKNLDLHT